MRIIVDRDACDANGQCLRAAPTVFAFDADEDLIVDEAAVVPSAREAIERAVAACPKAAIRLVD